MSTQPQSMQLADLHDNQTVTYRLGRAGLSRVEWQPWTVGTLYVVRRSVAFRHHPKNEIITLTVRGAGWAEYGERDFFEGVFMAEDYYLEIKGLEDGK